MLKKITTLFILIFVLQFFGINESKAAHIYGGDISYIYLKDTVVGGSTMHLYYVLMTVYYDCNDARYPFRGPETIAIYEGGLNITSLPLSSKVAVVSGPLNGYLASLQS